jgi:hemerythrin
MMKIAAYDTKNFRSSPPVSVFFQWESQYSVHDEMIDDEHRRLFNLANDVFAIVDPVKDRDRFKTAVKQLCQYMEYHFAHEEDLMRQVGYPDIAHHAAGHQEIIAGMNRLLANYRDIVRFAGKLRHFMLDWVLQHVVQEDSKIGRCMAVTTEPQSR